MIRPVKIFEQAKGRLPAERSRAQDDIGAYPEARMVALAVQNIPSAPADDDVPDEWLQILEGRA